MSLAVGEVVDGTVTGLTNFGAFVQLPEGKSGLVHISEISHEYVEKVTDCLKKGQRVKVKILSITDEGKISLSIRQAKSKNSQPDEYEWKDDKQKYMSFEDKLNKFLKDSNEKQDQLKTRDTKKSTSFRHKKATSAMDL
ncbi:MAG: S1 RNA-binding domain-containing protein [Tissierellaceae bacterium]|nr:S1 RNA-binding domain-containing protein [Tissierellaceae bacterium]